MEETGSRPPLGHVTKWASQQNEPTEGDSFHFHTAHFPPLGRKETTLPTSSHQSMDVVGCSLNNDLNKYYLPPYPHSHLIRCWASFTDCIRCDARYALRLGCPFRWKRACRSSRRREETVEVEVEPPPQRQRRQEEEEEQQPHPARPWRLTRRRRKSITRQERHVSLASCIGTRRSH